MTIAVNDHQNEAALDMLTPNDTLCSMRRIHVLVVTLWTCGCELLLPIVQDEGGADASVDVAAEVGANDAGVPEGRAQDNTTLFCGPNLECSRSNPSTGCCVSTGDSGGPPDSYIFTCEDKTLCTSEAGSPPLILCDQNEDCPAAQVCCMGSTVYPLHTFCFQADAGNCFVELCDPSDQPPCVNHVGYTCVPSGSGVPAGKTTPLGYFICVP